MTVPPLQGPHIQATGYRRGRARAHTPGVVPWLALHTTEGITDEIALGNFWRGRQASSHAGIGRDGGYATYVRYGDTAWTNPPVHDDTETLEICAMAGWSRATWLRFPKMLETVAHWIAWRSEVRGIPIVRREGAAVRSFTPGVVDHDGINDVFRESTHWDVGESFPWDVVLGRAIKIRQGTPQTPPEDDVSVADVRIGIHGIIDEAAQRNTPTGRQLGDDLAAIIGPIVREAVDAALAVKFPDEQAPPLP